MKTAIDFYTRGKQKEANADEYDRKHFYSRNRFLCPECGEPVHLTGSKYSNHFSHFKKSDVSAVCDRRVDGIPIESVYERIGMPVYLQEDISNHFSLYLGFKTMPLSLLKKAQEEKIEFTINGRITYKVNLERFSAENTTYLQVDFVPASDQKYLIHFTPDGKSSAIKKYWSNYADGFSDDGALFTVSERQGKKIRHGDFLSSDTEYYWLRRQQSLPSYIPGIKFKRVGELELLTVKYYVFKGIFLTNITDSEFDSLTNYLRNNLKVHLLEKQPEVVPVWPPVIKHEDGYMVNEGVRKIYGHVVSGNDDPKVYLFKGIDAVPIKLNATNSIVEIPISDANNLVNVDRKYVSTGIPFSQSDYHLCRYIPEIQIVADNEEKYSIHESITIIQQKEVTVYCEVKIEAILVHCSGEIERIFGTGNFTLKNLKTNDVICFLTHGCLRNIIKIDIPQGESETADVSIIYLRQFINKYKNSKKVVLPLSIRKILIKINNDILNYEITNILKGNAIPIPVLKLLEETKDVYR